TYNPVSFGDVPAAEWHHDAVNFIAARRIVTGTGNGKFSPDIGATRAMLVTVLHRLSGDSGSHKNSFSDVLSGAWYESAAGWAAANSIVSGVGGGLFAPDKGITREQLAVMLYNYAKFKDYNVSAGEDTNILSYSDALSISDYAYTAMQWACGAGIVKGDTKGRLNPQGAATRAEIAAMLERFIRNVAK
ncbi:S-layer homology domain-containing protein, partial [Syntrophomonas palmitatica]|uniref:S-layer homology domain-containing protein n=1 Tax=Syntrophomonas palmitatica TaxID=402877 RepID=UPI000A8ABC7E